MMAAFLDLLAIPHENGLISRRNVKKPDADVLARAAAELAAKYPADDVSFYLGTLISQDPETWGALAEAKESLVPGP